MNAPARWYRPVKPPPLAAKVLVIPGGLLRVSSGDPTSIRQPAGFGLEHTSLICVDPGIDYVPKRPEVLIVGISRNVNKDIAAIEEVLNQYAVGCTTGDFDHWMSLWDDDGVQMPPDAPANVGKEEIRRAMKPEFDEVDMGLAILSVEDAAVFGNLGLTRCAYSLEITPKAGGETVAAVPEGKALTLYKRQSDGTWKIVYDCFNSSRSPE